MRFILHSALYEIAHHESRAKEWTSSLMVVDDGEEEKMKEKHWKMQFTRHEMPINIKLENDLLLWEIEVISVRRSNSMCCFYHFQCSELATILLWFISLPFWSRRTEKEEKKTRRRLQVFIWTSKEKLLLLQNSQHNEWVFLLSIASLAISLKRTQNIFDIISASVADRSRLKVIMRRDLTSNTLALIYPPFFGVKSLSVSHYNDNDLYLVKISILSHYDNVVKLIKFFLLHNILKL